MRSKEVVCFLEVASVSIVTAIGPRSIVDTFTVDSEVALTSIFGLRDESSSGDDW